MKVLQINYSDAKGGAAKASYRLNNALKESGIDSSMLVLYKYLDDSSIILYKSDNKFYSRLIRNARKFKINRLLNTVRKPDSGNYEIFSTHHSIYKDLANYTKNFDLVNLHWISGFLDFTSFFLNYPQNKSIVWTLHDMNPFTGGCHYDNDCGKFEFKCGCCPQIGSKDNKDITNKAILAKYKVLKNRRNDNLSFVSPSRWLKSQIDKSFLFGNYNTKVIPNGIDTNTFQPRDKVYSRKVLGLPIDKKIVLTGFYTLDAKRKGINSTQELFANLNNNDIFLVSFGYGKINLNNRNYKHLGFIKDDIFLSIVYSAADLFLITSIQDNLPNTVVESISCGTPVIGFDIGGIPEIIENDQNGILIKNRNLKELEEKLISLLNNEAKLNALSINARETALKNFDSKIQSENYFDFYKEILNK
ncbi:MAG: glycosyltransferase [Thermodesulfobacteriota bacterium]